MRVSRYRCSVTYSKLNVLKGPSNKAKPKILLSQTGQPQKPKCAPVGFFLDLLLETVSFAGETILKVAFKSQLAFSVAVTFLSCPFF